MSGGNGSGQRFQKFHERVSKAAGCDIDKKERLPFAPDFLDNLVRRIATGDLKEAFQDWAVYRAWNNQQEFAVHVYAKNGETPTETPLRQHDSALEVAWLRAGHPPEWWDAPLDMFRAEAGRRGVKPIDKSLVSEAFTFNRMRGTIARDTGHLISPTPTPKVGDSTEIPRTKGESPEYRAFLEEWNVANSAEFQEYEVARSTIKRLNKVRLSAYKKWKQSRTPQTNGAPSYKPKTSINPSSSSPAVSTGVEPTTTTNPPPAPPAETPEVPAAGTARPPEPESAAPPSETAIILDAAEQHGITLDDHAAISLVAACRQKAPGCPVSDVVHFLGQKAELVVHKHKSIAYLKTAVATCFVGESYARYVRRREAPEPVPKATTAQCPRCQGRGVIGGVVWQTIADLRPHGDKLCDCEDGQMMRSLVFDEVGGAAGGT